MSRSPQTYDRPLLTVVEVAKQINVSVRTVRRLIADGELKPIRFGRSVRIEPPALRDLLRRKRSK